MRISENSTHITCVSLKNKKESFSVFFRSFTFTFFCPPVWSASGAKSAGRWIAGVGTLYALLIATHQAGPAANRREGYVKYSQLERRMEKSSANQREDFIAVSQ